MHRNPQLPMHSAGCEPETKQVSAATAQIGVLPQGTVALASYLDLPGGGLCGGAVAAGAFKAVNPTDN